MNNQEHLSSQSAPETTEEAFSLEEEQLNQVTGAGGIRDLVAKCDACFRGQQAAPQPHDRFVLGRTASGHNVYDNAFAAQEALDAKSHPENWRIGTGSVHTPTESIESRGGYVIRPKEHPSFHTTPQI